MRKCGSCGSLALGDVSACARCGTPLAAPADASAPAGAPAQVPSYGRLSIPSPVGGPAGAGTTAETLTPPPEFREAWQPVSISVPVDQPRSTRLGLIALAVAVVVVGGLLAVHLRSDPLPKGTSAFVAGRGVTFTAPDNSFQVQLPITPETGQRTVTVDGQVATIFAAAAASGSYGMFAASIELPTRVAVSRVNAMLDAALTADINGPSGTLVHKNLMLRESRPAIEGTFSAPGGRQARILIVASGSTLVMLMVEAKSGTEQLYKALESSLLVH